MSKVEHGANLFELASKYGFNIDEIMDFSSNINPFGASPKALSEISKNPNLVSIYPDPSYTELKQAISTYTHAAEDNILLGSGATGLISGFIKYIHPQNSMILSPAYSEYKRELTKINSNIFELFLSESNEFKPDIASIIDYANSNKCDLIVICNPNNPTGSILTSEEIKQILRNTDAYILVDETYIEFTDQSIYSSSVLVDEFSRLFVIRGTSKFFSTPGIRLGYALSSDSKIKSYLQSDMNLWSINIFADRMGQLMFLDKKYQAETFELIEAERSFIFNELSKINQLKTYPSKGNFILSKILNPKLTAYELYQALLPYKIIIRNCSNFPGLDDSYFRVCVLKPEENKLLIEKLNDIFSK